MSGAAYDVHPLVLLNHQDDYNSARTYAHEWGHAMHQVLTNENQPYELADFSIFTTEIAAIANELLLQEYMLTGARTEMSACITSAMPSSRCAVHSTGRLCSPSLNSPFTKRWSEAKR